MPLAQKNSFFRKGNGVEITHNFICLGSEMSAIYIYMALILIT